MESTGDKKKQRLLDVYYDSSEEDDVTSSASSETSVYHDPKEQEKIKDDNEKIRNLLKTKSSVHYLLSKYENDKRKQNNLLLECTNKIIESVFGGLNNILYLLIDNASNAQLKQIHQIIKSINNTNKNKLAKQKSVQKAMDIDSKEHKSKQKINLNSTSTVSISHICGFVGREDIQNFKLVSRRISIICLEEMLKFTIKIFNMNELVLFNDFYKNKKVCYNTFYAMIKEHRYHPNRKISQLKEQWSKHYGITIQHQLLYPIDACGYENGLSANQLEQFHNLIHSEQKIINFYNYTKFILFDTSNIVYINNKNQPKYILKNINNEALDNGRCLLILKYFDLFKQTIQCIQFLIIDNNITYNNITNYIKHQFITKNKQQATFHQLFKENIKKMQFINSNEPMVQFYQFYHSTWHEVAEEIKNKPICSLFKYNTMRQLVFQLNPKHEYIANNFISDDNDTNTIDYILFNDRLFNLETFRLESCVEIEELKLMITSFDGGKVAKYIDDFDKKYDGKSYEEMRSNLTFGAVRQLISNDISDGTVNAHNIELFINYGNETFLCPWYEEVYATELEFTLVPYDVVTVNHSIHNIYSVSIFLPTQCPLPFCDKVKTSVMVIYNKTFLVKDFIDYIFDDIIQRPLYKKQLEHISDFYNENKQSLHLIFAKHHESKGYCRIMKGEYKEQTRQNVEYPKQVEIDLYLLTRPNTSDDMKLLTIRFIKCGLRKSKFVCKKYNDLKDRFFVGLPLEIWLNRNGSKCLKAIMNNNIYFNKYKDYIDQQTVFKVEGNGDIVAFCIEDHVLPNDMILFGLLDTTSASETMISKWFTS